VVRNLSKKIGTALNFTSPVVGYGKAPIVLSQF